MKRKTNKTKEEAWSQTAHAPDGEQPGPEASQPAQPDWKPQTQLEHLSVELMNWFDDMMGA